MQFGCFLPNVPPDFLKDIAMMADSLGFDCLWGSDHLMSPFPPVLPDYPGYHEAWTTICYLAGMTKNIRLSHQALVTAFRNPGLLASMASTLDNLTQGRLILTTGAGWYQPEFEAFGIPWLRHAERIKREREAIQIIRSLWTKEKVTFRGTYYKLVNAAMDPKPYQTPCPPIWVAGDSRRSMELAAELGDGWFMHGHSPEEIARMISKIAPLLQEKNGSMTFATSVFISMGSNREEADKKMHAVIPEDAYRAFLAAPVSLELKHRILGPPGDCVKRLKQYSDAGIEHMVLVFIDPEDIKIFAQQVIPEFKGL